MSSAKNFVNFVRSSLSSRKPKRREIATESRAICTTEAVEPRLLLAADLTDALFDAHVIGEVGSDRVDSYLVRFNFPQDQALLAQLTGAESVVESPFIENAYTLDFQQGKTLQEAADTFAVMPNFDYMHPNVLLNPVVHAVPNDPLYPDQWHFNNTGQSGGLPGADSNIESVWDNYTGAGVVIGIIDDSLETGHEDFAGNVNTTIDFDYRDGDNDPNPVVASDNHGTAVAGIAAAKGNNGIGGTGAAWDAELVGLRLIGGPTPDSLIASALSHESQIIDIYNNSWGFATFGRTFSTPPQSLAALETTAQTGRGGLGNVQVFSAGNSGQQNDNVNYTGFAKSRHTIAIAALLDTGVLAPYSTPGAPLIVGGWADPVTTTDRTGAAGYDNSNYTSTFNGTSSAAPHVSGVIALMLEANPSLAYRDVVDILVHSSEHIDQIHPDWVQNGAGLWVNHDYGYGGIDAAAAVDLALNHTNLPAEEIFQTGVQNVAQQIPDQGSVSSTVTIPAGENLQIEHVELVMNASHSFIGDLEIVLTSPAGTDSVLANTRPSDAGTSYSNFTFMSARHWDEFSAGEWTVTVRDGAAQDTGTFNSFELIIYGTTPQGIIVEETGVDTVVSDYLLTDLFSVSLPNQPATDVVVNVTSQNIGEVTVQPTTLTFTPQNYNIPQDVEVSGVLDLITDGNQLTNVVISIDDALSDDSYDNIDDVFVQVTSRDDDGTVPGKPTFTSPDPFDGGNRPVFAWTPGIRSETFDLEVKNVLTGQIVSQTSGLRGTSFSFGAAFPDGLYEATVQAFNTIQQGSELSDVLVFNVGEPIVPAKPTITAPVVGSILAINQPTIEWTAVPAALNYELYFRTGRTVTRVTTPGIDLGNGLRGYVVPSPLAEGDTSVWVRGFNFFGTAGIWSDATRFTTNAFETPLVPRITSPLVDTTADAFPVFEWTSGGPSASYYQLWVAELRDGTGTPQVPAIYDRVIHRTNESNTFYKHFKPLAEKPHRAWVRAFNQAGEASRWSVFEEFGVSVPDPGVPAPVGGINTQDTTPTFEWSTSDQSPGTTYRLWVNNLNTGETRVIDESGLTGGSYTPKIPLDQGRHAFWVRGTNSVGELGQWSERAIINIDVLAPDRPEMTGPVPLADSTVVLTEFPTFTWDSVFNGATYQLWVNHDDSNTSQVINVSGIEGTSYTAQIALPQGNFRAWTRASNSAGEVGRWSAPISFFLDVPTPSKPEVIAPVANPVGVVIDSTPTIRWQVAVPGNTYDLQLVDVVSGEMLINTTGLTDLSYTVPFELQEREFQVRVRSVNTIGEPSEWSDFYTFRVDEPNATTPTALGPAGTIRQNDLVFTWRHSPDSIRYEILVRDLIREENIVLQAENFEVDNGLNIASFDHSLNNGTYRFWVRAFNSQGTASGWSNSVAFIVDNPLASLESLSDESDGLLTSLSLSHETVEPKELNSAAESYPLVSEVAEEEVLTEEAAAIEMVMAEIADPEFGSQIGVATPESESRKALL